MNGKRLVIDASVALKWHLRDEEWFVTGDKRLCNAVGHVLSWVKWLGNYQFDPIPEPDPAMPESPDA